MYKILFLLIFIFSSAILHAQVKVSGRVFDITKYKDTYDEELMKLVEAKAKGKTIRAPKAKTGKTKTVDLMEQLKASLGSHKKAS